jgi:hypothetical protein
MLRPLPVAASATGDDKPIFAASATQKNYRLNQAITRMVLDGIAFSFVRVAAPRPARKSFSILPVAWCVG